VLAALHEVQVPGCVPEDIQQSLYFSSSIKEKYKIQFYLSRFAKFGCVFLAKTLSNKQTNKQDDNISNVLVDDDQQS